MDRYEIAWRIWCWQQGYGKAEDREGLRNWMREPDSQLHPDDIKDRDALLPIADMAIEMGRSRQIQICEVEYVSTFRRTRLQDLRRFGHERHTCQRTMSAHEDPENGSFHKCQCGLSW